MPSGMIGDKRRFGSAWGWRGQGSALLSAPGRARAQNAQFASKCDRGVQNRRSGFQDLLYNSKAGSI